jgi:ribosome recycling factor
MAALTVAAISHHVHDRCYLKAKKFGEYTGRRWRADDPSVSGNRVVLPWLQYRFAGREKEIMAGSAMAGIPALKETYQLLKTRMDKAVEDFRTNLASIRTGRASVHMLDQVKVLAYGTEMPLNQVGQISAPEPQQLLIQPYDISLIVEIEKALRTGSQGFNPQNDGKVVRVPVPPMTEERRKEVVKHLNKVLEDHRTAVRNVRRDGNDLLKKATKEKKISEDEEKRSLEEMQKLTDEEIKRMEELCKAKEKEVMQV